MINYVREITYGKEQVIRTVDDFTRRKVTHPDSIVIRYWNVTMDELLAQAVVQGNYIYYVVVNPLYRGEGLGASIVKEACSLISGAKYLIPQDNKEELIQFYQKLGFEEESRNEAGEIIMVKRPHFSLTAKHHRTYKELVPGAISFVYREGASTQVLLTTTIKKPKREDQQLSMAWNFALKEARYPFQKWIVQKHSEGWTLEDFKQRVTVEQ